MKKDFKIISTQATLHISDLISFHCTWHQTKFSNFKPWKSEFIETEMNFHIFKQIQFCGKTKTKSNSNSRVMNMITRITSNFNNTKSFYSSFVWKILLDERPKHHVRKFHEIHSKSTDFIELCRFKLNLQISTPKSTDSDLNLLISKSKSADLIRILGFHYNLQISMKASHLSELNRETSNNERPLA